MSKAGWIAVDLDGTFAHYEGWKGADHIGAPIPAMLERIKRWLAEGREVRIFTARVYSDGTPKRDAEAADARGAIEQYCLEHLGRLLKVTNQKDYGMVEQWDDRAVRCVPNTGQPCCGGEPSPLP